MNRRIVIVSNTSWNLLNFRMNLAATLRDEGFEVHFIGSRDGYQEELQQLGYEWHEWKARRNSVNPLLEAGAVIELWRIYRRVAPAIVQHFTVKPVLYGTVAARLARVHGIVNNVTGIPVFVMSQSTRGIRGIMRSAALRFYASSLHGRNVRPIFQNKDDLAEMTRIRPQIAENATLTAGSGIDLTRFEPRAPGDLPRNPVTVTFVGRMIKEKGIFEFVEAVRQLHTEFGSNVRFIAAGGADSGNRSVVPAEQLDGWKQERLIDFLGHVEDIRSVLDQSDLIVLPSWREGTPRALLEAAASGLPAVTTDVPGCRQVVVHEETGLLVPPENGPALADAVATLLRNPEKMRTFGAAARRRAEDVFDENVVIRKTLAVYKELMPDGIQGGMPVAGN